MSLRHRIAVVLFFLIAFLPFTSFAQQTPTPGGTVHGMVVDPDDALIPGATATLTSGAGKSVSTTSKSDGTYTFRGVAPGTYTLTVSAPGFATYSKQSIAVTASANIAADVKMALQDQTQTVNVTTDTVQLSVDPENNQSSTVITGDALNALSDDPDELQTELTALAGPSAGPNGGQIYIDGFTGGQLPPKSSILAIRINFPLSTINLGTGALRSSPSRERTSSMAAAASSSRTKRSTHRRRSWARPTVSRTITRSSGWATLRDRSGQECRLRWAAPIAISRTTTSLIRPRSMPARRLRP